jgi:hypothetical protein
MSPDFAGGPTPPVLFGLSGADGGLDSRGSPRLPCSGPRRRYPPCPARSFLVGILTGWYRRRRDLFVRPMTPYMAMNEARCNGTVAFKSDRLRYTA